MTAAVDTAKVADRQPVETPDLVVGTAYSLKKMSEARILALAAASVAGSDDPVDQAAVKSLHTNYPELAIPAVDPADVDPASMDRRYSVVRVRDCPQPDGEHSDVVVMRGDLDAVLAKVHLGAVDRSLLKRNAAVVTHNGWRPLAIASADVDADGKVGPFSVQGFVPVCPENVRHSEGGVSSGIADWARVTVWSASLRIQHWSNVALIFILSCTGLFIMDPLIGPDANGGRSGFLMGWVRLIHFTAGFLWLLVGLTRIWSAFTSRDRYLRWPAMWPLKSKEDVRNLGRVIQHYVFVKKEAPLYLGHNPLQQLTYLGVYVACAFQMLVGFMLFGIFQTQNPFFHVITAPVFWIGIPYVRLIHVIIMFLLWMFVIAHVYMVFRSDSLERHGGVSAMINGGVWVQRGAQPVDSPRIE